MADKKLSSVSAVSDMNFVYAETSSGETVKISKADLASVVAGMIPSVRYIQVTGENKTSLQLELSKISWNETYPRRWDFFGGDWQRTNIYYASGIARIYETNSNYNSSTVEYKSIDSISCSLSSSGVLTVDFGRSISFVCLRLYY